MHTIAVIMSVTEVSILHSFCCIDLLLVVAVTNTIKAVSYPYLCNFDRGPKMIRVDRNMLPKNNKTGNVHNVLRRVRATIVVVEKQ